MYNYLEALKEDIKSVIFDYVTIDEIRADRNDAETTLCEALWAVDEVTGNETTGGYFADKEDAKKAVYGNTDLCLEALKEFCVDADEIGRRFLNNDYVYFDATIRCYLLSQAIADAVDEIILKYSYVKEV